MIRFVTRDLVVDSICSYIFLSACLACYMHSYLRFNKKDPNWTYKLEFGLFVLLSVSDILQFYSLHHYSMGLRLFKVNRFLVWYVFQMREVYIIALGVHRVLQMDSVSTPKIRNVMFIIFVSHFNAVLILLTSIDFSDVMLEFIQSTLELILSMSILIILFLKLRKSLDRSIMDRAILLYLIFNLLTIFLKIGFVIFYSESTPTIIESFIKLILPIIYIFTVQFGDYTSKFIFPSFIPESSRNQDYALDTVPEIP
uniref:Uncharacterized protein n=2 Tax=Lepeophtheirus salmonis TaxID=72036 RepID=A0A0K2TKD6_LEPSM